jgi:ketopantoate hydroxymethyltransferase
LGKRVLLVTRDLVFRSKLAGVIAAVGGAVTRDEAQCDLAVLELAGEPAAERVAQLVRRGIPVLAFGAHVQPEALRAAREAGATAVPNSQVEARLNDLLNE